MQALHRTRIITMVLTDGDCMRSLLMLPPFLILTVIECFGLRRKYFRPAKPK